MSTNVAAFDFKRNPVTGDDGERLELGTQAITVADHPDGVLWLNGHMMHVCAFEVEYTTPEDEDMGEWHAVQPMFEPDLESVCQLIGGCPKPVELPGLTGLWVLYCLPQGE